MLKSDALSQLKQLKQDIKASRNLHTGTVKGTPNKFGFVTLDSGKDIFLPADEMARVLPGDQVEIEVKKEPKNKVFGVLERLLESPTKEFFGKYMTRGSAHFVVPDVAGLNQWFFIPPPKRKNAKANDYVHCKLTQHPYKTGKAQASVLEVIGNENDVGIEWTYSLRKHGLRDSWNEKIEQEIQEIVQTAHESGTDRDDLTALPFVTIDSETSQDLDDALYAEKTVHGWKLSVAIADPASFIAKGSEIEKELLARATSCYMPGYAIPMLPRELSSGHCSLLPEETRRAKVLELEIDASGSTVATSIKNALIRSHKKLSFEQASELLQAESADSELEKSLQCLGALAETLDQWRVENALISPSRDEFYLELNESKKIQAIVPRVMTHAHRVVEACMVVANRAIAAFVSEHASSSVYVVHSGVRDERLESLSKVLSAHYGETKEIGKFSEYRQICAELVAKRGESTLYSLVTRQQERAKLSSVAKPHYAMGLECYTTFTSPLRKASDYLLHQQLDGFLETGEWNAISDEALESIDQGLQASRNTNYELEQWLKCQFLNKSKEVFEAEVLRVFASGCQIRLTSNGVEGFISARELPGKFSYDQDLMTLKGQELSFSLDQTLSVSLKMIDWKRKQLQFLPVQDA